MKINKQKGGIIKFLIIVIALIALASFFFNFSVQDVVENPQTQQNFSYIWTHASSVYHSYLATPVNFIWNDIITNTIWHNFIENRNLAKAGKPTIFEQSVPLLQIPS